MRVLSLLFVVGTYYVECLLNRPSESATRDATRTKKRWTGAAMGEGGGRLTKTHPASTGSLLPPPPQRGFEGGVPLPRVAKQSHTRTPAVMNVKKGAAPAKASPPRLGENYIPPSTRSVIAVAVLLCCGSSSPLLWSRRPLHFWVSLPPPPSSYPRATEERGRGGRGTPGITT